MLTLYLIDTDSAATQRLCAEMRALLTPVYWEADLLPELRLVEMPRTALIGCPQAQLCVIGPKLLSGGAAEIDAVRGAFPHALLLGRLSAQLNCLTAIKSLSAQGLHDVLRPEITPQLLIEKLLILQARLAGAA